MTGWQDYIGGDGVLRSADQERHLAELFRVLGAMSEGQGKDTVARSMLTAYDGFMGVLTQIETGMAGDVLAAVQGQERDGQTEGDYLSDPVAVVSNGRTYGPLAGFVRGAGGLNLHVTVGMDCSGSMSEILGAYYPSSGGTPQVYDLGRENPLFLAPLIFFASLVTRTIMRGLDNIIATTGASLTYKMYLWSVRSANGVSEHDGRVYIFPPGGGGGTNIAPYLERLQIDESTIGGPDAARLDIVVTDGEIYDLFHARVADVQTHRGQGYGSLQTVILKVQPYGVQSLATRWEGYSLPPFVSEVAVGTPQEMAAVMRQLTTQFMVGQ